MDYIIVKWIHVVSSTILFGTGLGSAFYLFAANRTGNVANIHFGVSQVVVADWLFTSPAIVIQLGTGLWLMHAAGYSLADGWIHGALALFFFAGLCWVPVVWIQIRMRDLAKAALKADTPLPQAYWRLDRLWIIAGALAFPAVLAVFYLMVAKP